MRLKIRDEESVLNIDKSALFDIFKRLHLAKGSYHPVSPIQSDQDYITPPSTTEGYVPKTYEDSVPNHFAVEREYSEPYQPQVQQLIAKIIQRAPMLQSLLQQSPLELEQSSDAGYDSEDARIVFEFLLEQCRLRDQEADGIGNAGQDAIPDPPGDPSLSSLVSEIMPEDMPDMDQMPKPPMSLDTLVESAMAEAMPDQMPELQEPEQDMTLEMLINLLLGG